MYVISPRNTSESIKKLETIRMDATYNHPAKLILIGRGLLMIIRGHRWEAQNGNIFTQISSLIHIPQQSSYYLKTL